MKPQASHNLQQVARLANVSAMTVSRVLRHSPRVLPATRLRVEKAIRRLAYQPDPQLSRLMSLVRSRKALSVQATLAVIRDEIPRESQHDPSYQYVAIKDIRRRAAQHGYSVEEFQLKPEQLSPGRLATILNARGIEGCIISPQSATTRSAQIDFSGFATATFGYGLSTPSLHRVSTNMTRGILMAATELSRRGYQRIGLAITQWINARSDFTYSGAMLHFHQTIPIRQRVPLLLFPESDLVLCEEVFCRWMKTHRPDAIISFNTHVPGWLKNRLGLRIPKDIGLAVHDWTPSMDGLAGIHHNRAAVAEAAVDLVAHQLLQNERGIPKVPRQILIPPTWMDGASLRPVK